VVVAHERMRHQAGAIDEHAHLPTQPLGQAAQPHGKRVRAQFVRRNPLMIQPFQRASLKDGQPGDISVELTQFRLAPD